MLRRPLRSTRTDTLFPYTTRFRSDIEIPDEQGGQGERLGPARHPLDEIELLPEFGIERAIGDVAAGGHVDVLDPHPVRQPHADMPRLAVRLPVEPVDRKSTRLNSSH